MYLILNKDNIIIDVSFDYPIYAKQTTSKLNYLYCSPEEARFIKGYYDPRFYDLNEIVMVQSDKDLPEAFTPWFWRYNTKTKDIEPLFSTEEEYRQLVYKYIKCVNIDDVEYTVNGANRLWLSYMAEGNAEKANEISTIIRNAKNTIRENSIK